MRELLQEVGGDLKGKAGFAAASSASEGEQPAGHEQPSDRGDLAFAANKAVHLERQIVRRGVELLRHCYIFHGMPSSYAGRCAPRRRGRDNARRSWVPRGA